MLSKEGAENIFIISNDDSSDSSSSDPSNDPVAVELMLEFVYRADYETSPNSYHLDTHKGKVGVFAIWRTPYICLGLSDAVVVRATFLAKVQSVDDAGAGKFWQCRTMLTMIQHLVKLV